MQQFNGSRLNQPFGRAIEQIQLTGCQGIFRGTGLFEIHGGIQKRCLHPEFPQRGHLILHEGDQRRDHNGSAGPNQCGHLVTQGFTTPGGH